MSIQAEVNHRLKNNGNIDQDANMSYEFSVDGTGTEWITRRKNSNEVRRLVLFGKRYRPPIGKKLNELRIELKDDDAWTLALDILEVLRNR